MKIKMIECYKCHQPKYPKEFTEDKSHKRGRHGYCKSCKYSIAKKRKAWLDSSNKKWMLIWRRQNKLEAIYYKGGKCVDCGYDGHPAALCFHHLSSKDAKISDLIKNGVNERTRKELDKCVLLCHNCHQIRHYGAYRGDEITRYGKKRHKREAGQ